MEWCAADASGASRRYLNPVNHVVVTLLVSLLLAVQARIGDHGKDQANRSKTMLGAQYYDGKVVSLPLTGNSSAQLLDHWIVQATSNLITAYAHQSAKRSRKYLVKQFDGCANRAKTISKHAGCALELLSNSRYGQPKRFRDHLKGSDRSTASLGSSEAHELLNKQPKAESENRWIGSFRIRRSVASVSESRGVISRSNYQLKPTQGGHSTLSAVAKLLRKLIQNAKQTSQKKSWSTMLAELKYGRLKGEHQRQTESLPFASLSSKLLSRQKAAMKGASHRLGHFAKVPKLIREGVRLAMSVANGNVTKFDNKTVRLASPRFFALQPNSNEPNEVNFFSPSLLSLHDQGDGLERVLSVPEMLSKLKITGEQERNDLLELIAEATGITDVVHDITEKSKENVLTSRGVDGQPLFFTKKNVTEMYGKVEADKIDTFDRLYTALSAKQTASMNRTGYALLNRTQLELLYGPRSPYGSPEVLHRLSRIRTGNKLREHLVEDLKQLSKSTSFGIQQQQHRRHKRFGVSLTPFLLRPFILVPDVLSQPIVLSPVVLSPVILSPAVLGPFILSPWLFNPIILSPRVLGPFILNPLAFTPIVLSPLALHPFILSPGIFNPFVLSPLALSPFILSPQVGTPLILSPMVLNPLILNPMALSPLILSPFVLSPIIYSPQFIFALILSPYALSPLIESNLTLSSVVLSPSFLS